MIELRDYQQEAHDAIWAKLEGGEAALAVLGTGAGKTEIGLSLAARYLDAYQDSVLWLAHRGELVRDPIARIARDWEAIAAHGAGIEMASNYANGARFVSGSVQTLYNANRRKQFLASRKIGLIIYDEAHHSVSDSNLKLIELLKEHNPNLKLMGMTATPQRETKGEGLIRIFDSVAFEMNFADLIERGFLVPPRGMAVKIRDYLMSQLQKSSTGEYTASSVRDALKLVNADELVVKSWQEHAIYENGERRPTMVVTGTIEESKWIRDAFKEAGVRVAHVDGNTPKPERIQILEQLRNGTLDVVTNCGVFTEGTDIKPLGCILNMRPIRSKTLYTQIVGRGLRPYILPSGYQKPDCLVIDFAPNDERNLQHVGNLLGEWFEGDGTWHRVMDARLVDDAMQLDLADNRRVRVASNSEFFDLMRAYAEQSIGFSVQLDKRDIVSGIRENTKQQETESAQILKWLANGETADYEQLYFEAFELMQVHSAAFHLTPQNLMITPYTDGETIAIVPPNGKHTNLFQIFAVDTRLRTAKMLKAFSDLADATAFVDELVDSSNAQQLAKKQQAWHAKPPSDNQIKFAEKLGIKPDGLNRGQLSAAINEHLTISVLNRELKS